MYYNVRGSARSVALCVSKFRRRVVHGTYYRVPIIRDIFILRYSYGSIKYLINECTSTRRAHTYCIYILHMHRQTNHLTMIKNALNCRQLKIYSWTRGDRDA